jgi:uncharacterized protein YprB with RNaseH-like and TPR domain
MPDFAKALRGLERGLTVSGPPPATIVWKSHLAKFEIAGGCPLTVSPRSVLPPGEIRSNAYGSHYVTRGSYSDDYFHGRVRLSRLSSPDLDFLMRLVCEKGVTPDRERIVFLDTETTGVQGGTGICPFLIGLGFSVDDDFQMVQFFIRDFDEEPSMLLALAELLRQFELVVTYNGAAFDIPVLETRFTLARLDSPFERMSHFDLLFTARKLWRNGHGSCRLAALERELLSFMRGPDIPGAEIPRAYFDYLQRRASTTLYSVFTHNVYDVLSLAALTVQACDRVTFEPAPLDEPLDLYSLGRIFENSADWRRSLRLYEMALAGGVAEPMRQKILERLAVVCRRAGEYQRSREVCQELMKSTEFSIVGYEGAAIHAEHVARDYDSASRFLEEGLLRTENPRSKKLLQGRLDRLRQKAIRF